MRLLFLSVAVVVLLGMAPAMAADTDDELVGSVTNVTGTVSMIRNDKTIAIKKGDRLYVSDVLQTGEKSAVGIVLRDDTTLSMGASSEIKMSEFEFKPDKGILSMTLSVVKGTLAYVSGQIAKLAPGSVQIETPEGVAAVRGTELLVEVK